jgi:hypothetical protein
MNFEVGDWFVAVLKGGPWSVTLGGAEAAGRRRGPYKCTKILHLQPSHYEVQSEDFEFSTLRWYIVKVRSRD